MAKNKNLTQIKIASSVGPNKPTDDFSCGPMPVKAEVIFRNQQKKIINLINEYECILGAVAWFTDLKILKALRGKSVSMIVQKEDFLRPDSKSSKSELFKAYKSIATHLERHELPGIANQLSINDSKTEVEPFRCLGNFNREKSPAMPRMHNKFLIFCDIKRYQHTDDIQGSCAYNTILPKAVWTGSYNLSYNASNSFENAILLKDELVATAFANEFSQIFALSEPLNWKTDWVSPEYRIGT